MTAPLNDLIAMLESLRNNFSVATRHDRKYFKARLKVAKLAIRDCFEYEPTQLQVKKLKAILKGLKKFKIGDDGRLLVTFAKEIKEKVLWIKI